MVLGWLLGRRKPDIRPSARRRPEPARRRPSQSRRLPGVRACLYCGAILSAKRHGKGMYCSPVCWRRRGAAGAARVASAVHRVTNAARARAHRTPLRRDRVLDAVAQGHAADMAARGYYSHNAPGGLDPTGRARAAGYPFWKYGLGGIAENILMTTSRKPHADAAAREAVRAWMRSPGHRQNILDAGLGRLGVGIAFNRRGALYAVQNFC